MQSDARNVQIKLAQSVSFFRSVLALIFSFLTETKIRLWRLGSNETNFAKGLKYNLTQRQDFFLAKNS